MPVSRALLNVRVPMRDGACVSADVAIPAGEGPYPTVIFRSPYGRQGSAAFARVIEHGYALVGVDFRGRGDSDGEFALMKKDPEDGYDVVEWAAAQPWSTGKIGMIGGSYDGASQWFSAMHNPPHLRCIVPMSVGADVVIDQPTGPRTPVQYWLWWFSIVNGRTFQNPGSPCWEDVMTHLPLRTLDERAGLSRTAWKRYLDGGVDKGDAGWGLSADDFEALDVAALLMVGWWDDLTTLTTWEALQKSKGADKCRLLVTPSDHAGYRPTLGGLDFTAGAIDEIGVAIEFLDHWLKDDGSDLGQRVCIFRTGANRYDHFDEWPLTDTTPQEWYLHSGGGAQTLRGDGSLSLLAPEGAEPPDTFPYDPSDPVRTIGSLDAFAWMDPPLDIRYKQRRPDHLVYTSPPLDEAIDVSGTASLEVFVSSDRPDTDLFVELCDVHPDVKVIHHGGGSVRLRYRDGSDELLRPDEIVKVPISLSYLHHTFLPGHRIRVAVTSSSFPMMSRNLGGGGCPADETEIHIARNTLHHSADHSSRLVLPVQK